ncbi:MAG: GGDEF domain-containing protein, partial [Actinobacteria bacterium]|nr:GGDEF domain-containing protein [Actinomycetota bacterium]
PAGGKQHASDPRAVLLPARLGRADRGPFFAVGDILRAQVREDVDVPSRYGGEEFAVILPQTGPLRADLAETANGALATAERIRRAVAEVELPLPLTSDGLPAHITASVGVATLPAHAVDADDLVNKADRALYTAKQRGKDRVEVYVAG